MTETMLQTNRPPRAVAFLLTGSLMAALLLTGLAPLAARASGVTVTIGKHFYPSPVEIYAGQTVTWVNRDTVNHFVVSDLPGVIPFSGTIAPGKTFTFKFTKVGTWGYHDFYWDSMTGTVIVKAGPAPTPTPKPTVKPKPTPRPTPRPTAKPATSTTKATPKPTAKPTAKATATGSAATSPSSSAEASSSAVAVGAVGSLDNGSAGPGSAAGTGSSGGGLGDLGGALLALILAGVAFAAGVAIATRRRSAADALAPAMSAAGATAGSRAEATAAPGGPVGTSPAVADQVAVQPAPPPARYQMPGDVDDDAPLQNSAPPAGRVDRSSGSARSPRQPRR